MNAKRIRTLLKCLLLSGITAGIFLLLSSLLWYLLPATTFPGSIGKILMYTVSCFLSGFIYSKDAASKKYLSGMLPAACFSFLLILLCAFHTHSFSFLLSNSFFTGLLLCLLSGMLGGMLQK